MAYEPPQHDGDNLPERSNPSSNSYGAPKNAGDTIKTDPGDYSALPRSYLSVLSKSRPETYSAEIPNAGWGKTLLGLAIVTLVTFGMKIVLAPLTLENLDNLKKWLPTQGQDPNGGTWKMIIQAWEGSTSPLLALSVPITFFAGAWLLYAIAGWVRGKEESAVGGFMTHCYLLSLGYTPLLTIITLVTGLLPLLIAGCIVLIIALAARIYQLYNAGLAIQASQRLTSGQAQMVSFMPWVVGILLGTFVVILFAVVYGLSLTRQ